jgi:hypothetical protein
VYGGNYGDAHDYSNEGQSGDLWKLDLKSLAKWEKVMTGPKLQGLAMVGRQFRVLAQNLLWSTEEEGTESSKNTRSQSGDVRAAAPGQKQRVQYALVTVPGRLLIRSGDAIHCISER